MSTEELFASVYQNVARHISLSNEETEIFTGLLQLKEVGRKNILLREGQPCRHLNFVINGALRAYCMNSEGRESTIMFAVADWWVTDMYCFLNDTPSMTHIEAIEDSRILQLSRPGFDTLLKTIPKFERFFRILMQNAYTREQLRIIERLTLPAEERYDRFIQKYPQVVKQVTQKQIASYLGITPEFLSTIRRKKARAGIS